MGPFVHGASPVVLAVAIAWCNVGVANHEVPPHRADVTVLVDPGPTDSAESKADLAVDTMLQTSESEQVLVIEESVERHDVDLFLGMLASRSGAMRCGSWRPAVAERWQKRLSAVLGISPRRMSDVLLTNSSSEVSGGNKSSKYGGVAMLFLDEQSDNTVWLYRGESLIGQAVVLQGTAVIVPDGAHLTHSAVRRAAYVHLRKPDAPSRTFFEYYVTSCITQNFIVPQANPRQLKFLRAHTQRPKYWHAFFWSFTHMSFAVFFPACLPLACFGRQIAEKLSKRCVSPCLPSPASTVSGRVQGPLWSPLEG